MPLKKTGEIQYAEIEILTFDMLNVRLGIDVEQIAEICEPQEAVKRGLKILKLHETVDFCGNEVRYMSPKVLILKDKKKTGVVVNEPKDIITLNVDFIRPLPPLIDRYKSLIHVWAVAVLDNKMIVLIDLKKTIID
jgi:chemotaxis signal transduction protein